MRPFDFQRPDSLAHAHELTAPEEATAVAGGTNLLDLMKLQVETPERLVDINRLGMTEIQETANGGLRIGALATNTATANDDRVRADLLHGLLLCGLPLVLWVPDRFHEGGLLWSPSQVGLLWPASEKAEGFPPGSP